MELPRLYALRFNAAEQERKQRVWRVLCRSFFQRYVEPDATLLDVGAGQCEFINAIACRRRIALDLSAEVRQYAGPGVEVVQGISTDLEVLGEGTVDIVFASNVLEHLLSKDHVLKAFSETRRVLRPGGRILILQPNIRYAGGKYWDFFDHHLPLTERSLVEALARARGSHSHRGAGALPAFLDQEPAPTTPAPRLAVPQASRRAPVPGPAIVDRGSEGLKPPKGAATPSPARPAAASFVSFDGGVSGSGIRRRPD